MLLSLDVILIFVDIAIYWVDLFLDFCFLVKRIRFVLLWFEKFVDIDSEFFNNFTVF